MNFLKGKKKKQDSGMSSTGKKAASVLRKLGKSSSSFKGGGQALGGSRPGDIITVCFEGEGSLGMKIEQNHEGGAVIASVNEGTMAERNGLMRGDIICWNDSNGEECPFEEFMSVAQSGERPLTFDVKRIKLSKNTTSASANITDNSATAESRRAAVIAAAQNRANAEKKKQKPLSKAGNYNNSGVAKCNADLNINDRTGQEMSEATKKAVEATKKNERNLAKKMGYNPFETIKKSSNGAVTAAASGSMLARI